MKRYLICICLLIFCITVQELSAQSSCCPFIDSIRIFPAHPNKKDSVKIGLYVATPSPSKLISISHNEIQNDIFITACYTSDNTAAQIDFFADTLSPGKLFDGIYYIHVTAYYNFGFTNTSCNNVIDSTTITDSLVIQPPESAEQIDFDDVKFIYPNPANEKLYLPFEGSIKKLLIKDVNGITLQEYTAVNRVLDITALVPGVYFLYLETIDKTLHFRFLKK